MKDKIFNLIHGNNDRVSLNEIDRMKSSSWNEIKIGTKWEFVKKSDYGVKLNKKLCRRMKNMETGEIQDIYRADAVETEWHQYKNRDEWPDYVDISIDNGEVWDDEVDTYEYPIEISNPIWKME